MTDKINGFVGRAGYVNGQPAVDNSAMALTGSLDIFNLYTTVDITPTGKSSYNAATQATNYVETRVHDSQWLLDKIIEVISTRGQPVVLTNVSSSTVAADAASTAGGLSGTVYQFTFMIEHAASWFDNNGKLMLPEALNGVGSLVYVDGGASNNVAVSLVNEFKSTTDETAGTANYIF